MYEAALPPDWPEEVGPPGAPGWERSAVAWLYDLCPSEYRRYPLLSRHPLLLARLACQEAESSLHAARRGWSTARADLQGQVEPQVIDALFGMYAQEGPRLAALTRSVRLVSEALAGVRRRPRL
jgi:hypothetical protein